MCESTIIVIIAKYANSRVLPVITSLRKSNDIFSKRVNSVHSEKLHAYYDIYARNRRILMSRWLSRTKGENPGNFDSESRKCPEKLGHVCIKFELNQPGPEVIKLFPCSLQLPMKIPANPLLSGNPQRGT